MEPSAVTRMKTSFRKKRKTSETSPQEFVGFDFFLGFLMICSFLNSSSLWRVGGFGSSNLTGWFGC